MDVGPPPFTGVAEADDDSPPEHQHRLNSIDEDDDDDFNKPPASFDANDVVVNGSVSHFIPDAKPKRLPSNAPPEERGREADDVAHPAPDALLPVPTIEIPAAGEFEDEEWGEFGRASSSPAHRSEVAADRPEEVRKEQNRAADDNDDDDWGDFDQARPAQAKSLESTETTSEWGNFDPAPQFSRQESHVVDDSEWNGFAATSTSADNEDDWAADFVSAPPVLAEPEAADIGQLDDTFDDEKTWTDGFGDVAGPGDQEAWAFDIVEMLDKEHIDSITCEKVKRYSNLWFSLRIVEEAAALKHDWKNSQLLKNSLKMLKIDPEAPAKTLPPLLFTNVATLTPTPVTSDATNTGRKAQMASGSAKSSPTEPNVNAAAESVDPTVPVVDFDWDTSGLTNPLKGAGQSSAIMDIDFLSANSGGGLGGSVSTLQKDLDEFGLGSSTSTFGASSQNCSGGHGSALDDLMSRATTDRKYRPPSELSLDVRALHDQLPDIEYLRATMIMFPMGGGPWHHQQQ